MDICLALFGRFIIFPFILTTNDLIEVTIRSDRVPAASGPESPAVRTACEGIACIVAMTAATRRRGTKQDQGRGVKKKINKKRVFGIVRRRHQKAGVEAVERDCICACVSVRTERGKKKRGAK